MPVRACAFSLIVLASLFAAPAAHAESHTFVVNATGDSNDSNAGNNICFENFEIGTGRELCHLRSAIHEANNNGNPTEVDVIRFKIPGNGPHVIQINTDMHDIVEPVRIEGFSEPGSQPNTKKSGSNAKLKIHLLSGAGSINAFRVTADNTTIRGIRMSNFFLGVNFAGTTNGVLQGSEVLGGSNMVAVRDGGQDNVIGGSKPAHRNIISGGSFPLVISNNVDSTDVQGNLIGTTRNGKGDDGNLNGIVVGDACTDSLIGGPSKSAANTIAFNNTDGISMGNAGGGNRIERNSIHSNDGLGIDLGVNGVDPIDAGDPDIGPNGLQNYPTLDGASLMGDEIRVIGSITSIANQPFTIRYYASPVGDPTTHGEGKVFLGAKPAQTSGTDDAWVHRIPAKSAKVGWVISATATADNFANTSEFSQNELVT